MTYLLIGGAGYIGSHVAEVINKENQNKVIIYDNLSTGFKEFIEEKSKFIHGDILDIKTLDLTFKKNKIDVVIYLAGLIKVGESVQKPLDYYETNIQGLVNVLKTMKKHNVNNLVFSSSAAVYGNNSLHDGYFFEEDPKEPCSPYGRTKYFGEQIIKDFANTNSDFKYTFLRYFNVAGASKSKRIGYLTKNGVAPTHLIPAISYYAFGLIPEFKIFGNDYNTPDGTCIRDYVYVYELAELHLLTAKKMIKEKTSLYYNIGSSKGFSNLEVVNAFEKNLSKKLNIEYGLRRAGDPDKLIASNKKICKELNYEVKTNLDEIISSEIEFRKEHL
ncbi:UDP-glucose 4-epimerase (plasmid) [Mesomycoplasma conjunctivae]|nr:UDP-glucose 4-epimerase GalE [Mycoplasmopsis fermentans]ADV34055.1 UDP-glucose 4-epimerase [Mycoplasmopsis fermentans M64]VEU60084.1 UDP-glucose 4-epimerase [Mycoplasmopsis fermentans]VEU66908.1 UDP-glucose 4-epimerase [Mesomycoplasma conjunctivae]